MTFKPATAVSALVLMASPSLAEAHGGHLGELAGHSHWIGVAALAGAVAAAALAAKLKGRKSEEPADEQEAEAEAEPAQ